jgi:lysophospholipase L1-like esterase
MPRTPDGWSFAALFLAMAIAAQATTTQPSTSSPDPLARVKQQLALQFPHNRTINIVCHGHSVVAGYFKTPAVHTMDAYPHLLHEAICNAYPTAVVNVIVTAIGGENSEQGARRFARDVLSLHPDAITIDYALNDRKIGLERSKKAWQSMIDQARAAGVPVILLTPSWAKDAKLHDPNEPLSQHAQQIRDLAQANGCLLVDSSKLFEAHVDNGGKLDDLMAQINHPNSAGHQLIARELARLFLPAAP